MCCTVCHGFPVTSINRDKGCKDILCTLVAQGFINKVPQTGWLKITEIHCLKFLEARSSKSRHQQNHPSSETCREESSFASSSYFGDLLTNFGNPELAVIATQSLPPSSRGIPTVDLFFLFLQGFWLYSIKGHPAQI